MKWKDYYINLGNIKENTRHTLIYYLNDLKIEDVFSITPNCGSCTTVKTYDDTKLVVEYHVQSIPKHLIYNPGWQDIRKVITITYKDSSQEILSFTAKITK